MNFAVKQDFVALDSHLQWILDFHLLWIKLGVSFVDIDDVV
jgi:hypothetical protein